MRDETTRAEAAVRAVDRSLANGSATALLSVLSLRVAAEARHRLDRVLDAKARAELDPRYRPDYELAAAALRAWAARLYLAAGRVGEVRAQAAAPRPANPHSEAGISIRRHLTAPGRQR